MKIQVLADEVASQIAAGEVVERPASVVKELVENALDAGAKQVTVRIEQAGRRLIEISDDGEGIPTNEMELAVMRHATSKLRSAADLFHIQTLGFRGEALASIASVSHFTLISRQPEAELGARLVVDGGRLGKIEPLGVPTGTVVRVENLFYNVPARLKFLKQDATERQQIDGLVTRYALAYPDVRFHLFQDNRAVLQTSGNGERREVLAGLYGADTARQMLGLTFEEEGLKINGFISPVALTRSNRREITFFINGRWVQDTPLTTALLQAYHTLLMVGRYPMAVLFLELTPEEVDVNVHPAKAEVRFRNQDRYFVAVQRAARRSLLAHSDVPQITPGRWGGGASAGPAQPTFSAGGGGWQLGLPRAENPRQNDPAWEMSADPATQAAAFNAAAPTAAQAEEGPLAQINAAPAGFDEPGRPVPGEAVELEPPEPNLPSGQMPLLRLIGQVGATYLVAEGPDGLYLIDQHAAHERILFERMLRQRSGTIPSQALLEPLTFQLPPAQASLLQNQLPFLGKWGFDVELFGPNMFRVRSLPAMFSGADPLGAVRSLVEDFEEDETPLQAEIEARLVARICKRVAVKAGKVLSPEEQRALLMDLETCISPRTCPHGRPTMIHLSVDLLERQFGRRGSR